MSFHDDSHILSQLGILASTDEIPHKSLYSSLKAKPSFGKDRFVDVAIDGSTELKSESDDEEPVFDRNSLLSSSKGVKVYRREPETHACLYVILLLTYFGMGVWCPLFRLLIPSSNKVFSSLIFVNNTGLLVGSVAGKLFCKRMSITLLLFLCTAAFCVLSWIISDFPEVIDARISNFLLGFATGSILYGGLATWFIFWRGYNRKGLFFYVLLAVGSSFFLTVHEPTFNSGELKFMRTTVVPHKREVVGTTLGGANITKNETVDDSPRVKLRKPQVVQGIQSTETKSEQNQQMRKAVTSNNTKSTNVSSVETRSSYPTALPVDVQSSGSGGFISPILYTSATEGVSLTTSITLDHSSSSLSKSEISSTNISTKDVRIEDRATNVLTTTILAAYFVAFACCCIPFTVKIDMKFSKLFDPSIAGLTRGCRIRLATVQTVASLLGSLVELAAIVLSSQDNIYILNILHHVAVAISRIFVILSGPCAYSLAGCCLALACSSLGTVLLILPVGDLFFSFFLMSVGTGVFGLLVFFHVEARVNPRSGTQLDYYIFPSVVGRFLSTVFCTLQQPGSGSRIITALLVSSAVLVVAFILLAKSVGKAARLKGIMEYSSSPALDACGEYVSLIEKDVGFDSAEEEERGEVTVG